MKMQKVEGRSALQHGWTLKTQGWREEARHKRLQIVLWHLYEKCRIGKSMETDCFQNLSVAREEKLGKSTQRTHISTHIYILYQFHRTKQVTWTLEEGRQFPPQVSCVLRRRARHLDEQWKNVLFFFYKCYIF